MRRILVAGGLLALAVAVNVPGALGLGPVPGAPPAEAAPPVPMVAPVPTAPGLAGSSGNTALGVAPAGALPVDLPSPRPTAAPGLRSRGPAELVSRVETDDPVVFLTFDDGLVTNPDLIRFLARRQIPATAFLTTSAATSVSWPYWRDYLGIGSVQNHTVVHPTLTRLGSSGAAAEICAANEDITEITGSAPWMLRPPYGRYDATTLAAAGACGLDYVVMWTASLPGRHLRYQVGDTLRPGDIILSHFRSDLIPALRRTLRLIDDAGLRVARLEDYLRPRR